MKPAHDRRLPETLDKQVDHTIEEARMVLPGIQALFGFQLVAVFNQRFETSLTQGLQAWHLAATVLVAIAIALIMAPAAYHRQAERGVISESFVRYASTMITVAMVPLLAAIVIEVTVITLVVTGSWAISAVIGATLVAVFGWLWFVIPRSARLRALNRRRPI